MNNAFSFQRLSLLIRKQWAENSRFYGLATLALLGVMAMVFILFWLMMDYPSYHEDQTVIIYFVGLFLVGSIFSSTAFNALGEKEKGQYWMSVPATHAEKLVTAILFSMVLFFVVYTAVFFLVKMLAVQYIKMQMASDPGISFSRFFNKDKISDEHTKAVLGYLLLGFLAVQSIFLLGSIYFKKYAFIKTVIIVIAFFALYIFAVAKLFKGFLPENYNWEGYRVVFNNIPNDNTIYHQYSFGETFKEILLAIVKWIWAPLCWVIAWFRLREKEI